MNSSKTDAELANAVRAARRQHLAGGGAVLDVLMRSPGFDRRHIEAAMLRVTGVGVIADSSGIEPFPGLLDRARCTQWRCVVVRHGGAPAVAAEDPWDEQFQGRISSALGISVPLFAAPEAAIRGWLGEGHDTPGAVAPDQLTEQVIQGHGPIVDFVNQAMHAAFTQGASDVHFECDRGGVTAKHRIDGVMSTYARMGGARQAQECISRIKVMAQLDITERRLPQDGRLRFDFVSQQLDLRVSVMPSVHGEDAVLRILDKASLRAREAAVSLAQLGFDADTARRVRDLADRPSGMLLITGPTGSGKTTTVYAALSELNNGLEKIITIEDPVEYELQGVLQIPVNERKGLTFAKGLRSILRHDPDRILIGEIRDAETGEIAVQSALTGHVVFTTVHANSVADVIGRFRHFGLDMFGFMSALNGVVVQRLLRSLCSSCAVDRPIDDEAERAWLSRSGFNDVSHVPRAVGCPDCRGKGYRGRFVLAEVHELDDEFRDKVTEGAPLSAVRSHLHRGGLATLAEQAARCVMDRRTTTEEVKRVIGWS